MAYQKNNSNKKTNHTKIIPTKSKQNKSLKGNPTTPLETKITLENKTIETKTWKQATKNFMITYLLPLIFILFLSWVMFYKIMPKIGEDINNFIAGAKDNINKFCQESYNKFKNNAHDIKDNLYDRFKEWNWPDWLAKTGSIVTPILIGGVITLCCLAIPVIGGPLAAIAGICTIVVGGFMLFTDKITSQNPPTPPREDVTVIEHNENQQKDKEDKIKNPTKK